MTTLNAVIAHLKPDLRVQRRAALACARWGFAAASAAFFCFYAANLPWNTMSPRSVYVLDALFGGNAPTPELALAGRLGLTYEAALADPKAAIGKPVIWCVDHPAHGFAYEGGKPSHPLLLDNDYAFPINSPTTGGRCDDVLAAVTAVGPDAVSLRFIERH